MFLSFSGPSGLQPSVNLAPITVHDSDSEEEDENMASSRSCITKSIAQSYSDGEERVRDPVEIQEPLGESFNFRGYLVKWFLCYKMGLHSASNSVEKRNFEIPKHLENQMHQY